MTLSGQKIIILMILSFIFGALAALHIASESSNEQIRISISGLILEMSEKGKKYIKNGNVSDGAFQMECALEVADSQKTTPEKNIQFSFAFPLEYLAAKAFEENKSDDLLLATKGLMHGALSGIYKRNGNTRAHESHLNEAKKIFKKTESEIDKLSDRFIEND